MYKYKHTITKEIIEIEDIIVDSNINYFDSQFVEWWCHINDITKEIDKWSATYTISDNGMFK